MKCPPRAHALKTKSKAVSGVILKGAGNFGGEAKFREGHWGNVPENMLFPDLLGLLSSASWALGGNQLNSSMP